jgi:hypothetical protein
MITNAHITQYGKVRASFALPASPATGAVGISGNLLAVNSGGGNCNLTAGRSARESYVWRKTADETVVASTTMQLDDHLQGMSLGAGRYYIFAKLFFGTTTFGGSFKWHIYNQSGSINTSTDYSLAVHNLRSANHSVNISSIVTDGTPTLVTAHNIITFTANGELALYWAQNSGTENTVLYAGSFVCALKIG